MNIFRKVVFVIVNISCSRGLVWFNISQDNAGGWRNEEITNAIKVPNNHAILFPLWDDCYGDHCGTLMKLNISWSPRSKWSPTRRSWSTGWRSRAGVRRRRCSVIMLSQVCDEDHWLSQSSLWSRSFPPHCIVFSQIVLFAPATLQVFPSATRIVSLWDSRLDFRF